MIRWSQVYKWAGVLHMDIGSMTLWELNCAQQGHAEANGAKPKGTKTISDDRMEALGIEGF